MLLVVGATEFEMKPFRVLSHASGLEIIQTAVSGVGPVESAVKLGRLLERNQAKLSGIINFGIGGAYFTPKGRPVASMLDICLAQHEVLGDYGVAIGSRIEPFSDPTLAAQSIFALDRNFHDLAARILTESGYAFRSGNFVTVGAASGTVERGSLLCDRFNGLCENMEGAAIARVCKEFDVPMLEVRVISNLVEDRPGTPWKIDEAVEKAASAAFLIATHFQEIL